MKRQRQAAILQVIRARRIGSQEELRRALATEGYRVTQATLSRDVRELGLARMTDAKGQFYGQPADAGVPLDFQAVLAALLTRIEGVGPLLVLRTAMGSAGAVARAIDEAGWDEVLGTLAGEDTLLVITRSERGRRTVATRLRKLLSR